MQQRDTEMRVLAASLANLFNGDTVPGGFTGGMALAGCRLGAVA